MPTRIDCSSASDHREAAPERVLRSIGLFIRPIALAIVMFHAAELDAASPFASSPISLPPLQGGSVAVGDFDNDGLMDVALCGLEAPVPDQVRVARCAVWRNTGSGFVKFFDGLPQVGDGSLQWVDVNNDGYLDLVVSGITSDAKTVGEVWTFNGNSFSRYGGLEFDLRGLPFTAVGGISAGDFNNDGLTDLLLVANYDAFQFSFLFENTGSGFIHHPQGLENIEVLYYGNATVADFDNDGRLDFAVNGVAKVDPVDLQRTTIAMNQEAGFQPTSLASTYWDGAITTLDYDRDGREDLLIAGSRKKPYESSPTTTLWLNTPQGFLQAAVDLPAFSSGNLAVVDFDNDGFSDFLASGHAKAGSDVVTARAMRALPDGGFESVWSEIAGSGSIGIAWIDVDGDGRLDFIQTGNSFDKTGGRPTTLWKNITSPRNSRPSAPTHLEATEANGIIRLAWDSASDAETPSVGLSYNVRVGTASGKCDIISPMAGLDGVRRVVAVGNARFRHFLLLKKPSSSPLFWSVQAIDGGLLGGSFAAEQFYGLDARPPLIRVELQEGGILAIQIEGSPGAKYRIEATSHFEFDDSGTPTPWQRAGTATEILPGIHRFTEHLDPAAASRFFRAVRDF